MVVWVLGTSFGYMEYLNYDQDLELVAVVDPNKESSKYLSDHFLNNTGKNKFF